MDQALGHLVKNTNLLRTGGLGEGILSIGGKRQNIALSTEGLSLLHSQNEETRPPGEIAEQNGSDYPVADPNNN